MCTCQRSHDQDQMLSGYTEAWYAHHNPMSMLVHTQKIQIFVGSLKKTEDLFKWSWIREPSQRLRLCQYGASVRGGTRFSGDVEHAGFGPMRHMGFVFVALRSIVLDYTPLLHYRCTCHYSVLP